MASEIAVSNVLFTESSSVLSESTAFLNVLTFPERPDRSVSAELAAVSNDAELRPVHSSVAVEWPERSSLAHVSVILVDSVLRLDDRLPISVGFPSNFASMGGMDSPKTSN